MAQPRGLLKNDVVHEQRLMELHQEVGDDSVEILVKEFEEIIAVHRDLAMIKGNIYPIMRLEIRGVLKSMGLMFP